MTGDLERAVQMLAGDNCRLIDCALAADKLAEAVEALRYFRSTMPTAWAHLEKALDTYKAIRAGN